MNDPLSAPCSPNSIMNTENSQPGPAAGHPIPTELPLDPNSCWIYHSENTTMVPAPPVNTAPSHYSIENVSNLKKNVENYPVTENLAQNVQEVKNYDKCKRLTSAPRADVLDKMNFNPKALTFVPKADGKRSDPVGARNPGYFHRQASSTELTEETQLEKDIQELLQQTNPKKKPIPGSGYICHICYQREDHLIVDCPKKYQASALTTYQGPKRCFGEFQCHKCKRKWASRNSYANMSMQCNKCKIPTFPYKQFSLDRAYWSQGKMGQSSECDSGAACSSSKISEN